MNERPTYRPGEQPYDRLNGIRIGALAGGIAGAVPAALDRKGGGEGTGVDLGGRRIIRKAHGTS